MSGRYPLLMHIPTTVNLPDLFSIITWELQHQGCHVLGKKCHIGLAGFSNPVSENLVTQVSGNRAIPISFHTVWSLREEFLLKNGKQVWLCGIKEEQISSIIRIKDHNMDTQHKVLQQVPWCQKAHAEEKRYNVDSWVSIYLWLYSWPPPFQQLWIPYKIVSLSQKDLWTAITHEGIF